MSQAYVSYYYGGWPEGFKEWRRDSNAPVWLMDRNTGQAVYEGSDNGKERLFVRHPDGTWSVIGWKYTPFGYGSYHYRHVACSFGASHMEAKLWGYIESEAYREHAEWLKAHPQAPKELVKIKPAKKPEPNSIPKAEPKPKPVNKHEQKFIAAGLAIDDLPGFRSWIGQNNIFTTDMTPLEKVEIFYKKRPLEPLGLMRAGLNPEHTQQFLMFCTRQPSRFRKSNSTARQIVLFYNLPHKKDPVIIYKKRPFEIPEELETIKPERVEVLPLILHNAHVELMVSIQRRKRANELRALRRQAVREGQGLFRLHVLANHNGCAITSLTDGLEAAHIVPHAAGGAMSAANGLALVSWLHTAFDALTFTINPVTLTVVVAPAARAWLNIDGVQLVDGQIFELDRTALVNHFERFKEAHGL